MTSRLTPLVFSSLLMACARAAPQPSAAPVAGTPTSPAGQPPAAEAQAPAAQPPAQGLTGPEIPDGFVQMQVAAVTETPKGPAVLLTNPSGTLVVPIFISEGQALAIDLRLQRKSYVRPLTHDLFDALLRHASGRISSVRIDAIQDNVFVATVTVELGGRRYPLDARASDAIALALGNQAPIYMSEAVVSRAGVRREAVVPPAEPSDEQPGEQSPGKI